MSYLLRLIACLFFLLSFNAKALLIYAESLDGDLNDDHLNATPVGYLGVGTYHIYGSMVNGDKDFFAFDLNNSSLESISIVQWSPSVNGYYIISAASNIDLRQTEPVGHQSNIGLNLASDDLIQGGNFFNPIPLPHNFNLDPSANNFTFGVSTGTASVDYGFKIVTAQPVPLPAGIYLFLSGLVGLVGVKLRDRNA